MSAARKNRALRKTTKDIKNPAGDGRSNSSVWRSPIEKSVIPAGFVFFVASDTYSVHDAKHSTSYQMTYPGTAGLALMNLLLDNSEPTVHTRKTALDVYGYDADQALADLLRTGKITIEDILNLEVGAE